jgi:hypothetical protein
MYKMHRVIRVERNHKSATAEKGWTSILVCRIRSSKREGYRMGKDTSIEGEEERRQSKHEKI